MAADINISVINTQFGIIDTNYDAIKKRFADINKDYINGINKIWSSNASHDYIDGLAKGLSQFGKDLNKAFVSGDDSAMKVLQKAAANISKAEKGAKVNSINASSISSVGIIWFANESQFKIPEAGEVATLAKDTFEDPMNKIVTELENICDALDTLRSQGLSEYVSASAISKIKKVANDGVTLAKQYSSKNAENAAIEDKNSKNYVIG